MVVKLTKLNQIILQTKIEIILKISSGEWSFSNEAATLFTERRDSQIMQIIYEDLKPREYTKTFFDSLIKGLAELKETNSIITFL